MVAIAPPSRDACPATPNGETVSPTSARFLITTPSNGARTLVFSSASSATFTRARAEAIAASADFTRAALLDVRASPGVQGDAARDEHRDDGPRKPRPRWPRIAIDPQPGQIGAGRFCVNCH